jgi:hypothetical protein
VDFENLTAFTYSMKKNPNLYIILASTSISFLLVIAACVLTMVTEKHRRSAAMAKAHKAKNKGLLPGFLLDPDEEIDID